MKFSPVPPPAREFAPIMTEPTAATPEEVKAVRQLVGAYGQMTEQIGKVIVGQKEVVEQLLMALFSRGHCLLVGVPGLAKTLLVSTVSKILQLSFKRIQFTPDLMPADITGTDILQDDPETGRRKFVFLPGPIFANMILADEINRTPPKTQAALLEAMQELAVTVNGQTYPLAPPFVVVATQNPIEQEGTYPLPEAQLDRFIFSIHIDYPARADEVSVAARPLRPNAAGLAPVARREEFVGFTPIIDAMPVSPLVLENAVTLCASSRPKDASADDYVRRYVAWGAGPRATQHLVTAAKASALLDGRPTPEVSDLRRMAVPVLRHRIIANYNALGEGIESDALVQHLLERLKA
jgi:MoxR-like ATPase